ncbi:MAG: hypothetical protein KAI74_00095 [Kiritimatiellae bacterium]|nr:hypothetical protein [Kiritimatiellia bacterium]
MELEFKSDFEEAKKSWTKCWNGTNERPMLYAVVPKEGVEPVSKPSSYECTFGDIDTHIDRVLEWMNAQEFLVDAVPSFRVDFASDHFAALLGCELKGDPENYNTVWAEKCIDSWDTADIKFDKNGFWWQRTCEVMSRFRERCDGKFLISALAPAANLDALSAMRGGQDLLMDMMMEPEAVKEALLKVNAATTEVQAALAAELDVASTGRVTRHGMYCDGYSDVVQCDFSVMISPEMYDEFVIPSVQEQVDGLDVSCYHLDGEDAIRHLDSISKVNGLNIMQWVPGAGDARLKDWTDLRVRFDELGLGQLDGGDAEHIKSTWQSRRSKCLVYYPYGESRDSVLRLRDELYELPKLNG